MRFDIEHLPQTLYLADQVRELDRIAIREYGIPGFDLMSKAARFSFHAMMRFWPDTKHVLVLCGAGNNAGDGFVLASIAKKKCLSVQCITLSDPRNLQGDARSAYQECLRSEVSVESFDAASVEASLIEADQDTVLVDALLGTGLSRDVSGDYSKAIGLLNSAHLNGTPVLAIDIPSGLDANTGQPHGIAVEADLTATFIGNKLGLMTGQGRHYAGRVVFDDLDVPEDVYAQLPVATAMLPSLPELLSKIPDRRAADHKGSNGRALLIGGNIGFCGAILIASQACARLGAGLTSVITQEAHCNNVVLSQPEVMAHDATSPYADSLFTQANVIGIGPGLGQDLWAYLLLQKALSAGCFLVLDADALNLLAGRQDLHRSISTSALITPHPGEAARLLGCSIGDVEADRLTTSKKLQEMFGCHVLLKGSGSVISHPSGKSSVIRYGNPGMASGGMGDALTGMACALLAQFHRQLQAGTLETEDILELAVCLHAAASDTLSETHGQRGLLASDIALQARRLLNKL